MKNILFCLVLGLSLFACNSAMDDDTDILICTDDCLLTKVDQTGVINFTNCYDKWSITFDTDSLVAIIIDPPSALQEEDLKVEVTGKFFDNDFPFLMPDPPGPIQYKIELGSYNILN